MSRWRALFLLLLLPAVALSAESVAPGARSGVLFLDLARVEPHLAVELRYATARNLMGRAIYPHGARCLVRASVAERLVVAQAWLRGHAPGVQLKIWDGYRPEWAHRLLWQRLPDKEYLRDPRLGGSLHTWGVCVDATLCDAAGRDVAMPTDFDVLTPAAGTFYAGGDGAVRRHLRWLHLAMREAGFLVVRDEWWHFVARDYAAYGPAEIALVKPPAKR